MNPVADDMVVAVLLALSLGYALMKLGPRALRQKIQAVGGRLLASAPAILSLNGFAQRLLAASVQKSKGSCGGCDSCGSATPAPGRGAANSSEVSVPIGKIGRRA